MERHYCLSKKKKKIHKYWNCFDIRIRKGLIMYNIEKKTHTWFIHKSLISAYLNNGLFETNHYLENEFQILLLQIIACILDGSMCWCNAKLCYFRVLINAELYRLRYINKILVCRCATKLEKNPMQVRPFWHTQLTVYGINIIPAYFIIMTLLQYSTFLFIRFSLIGYIITDCQNIVSLDKKNSTSFLSVIKY